MYDLTTKQEATPERLAAVVAFNSAVNELERLALISDDKGSDLVGDTISLLNLPEDDEDASWLENFWEAADKAGVL